ncbi:MAG: hypothetical protein ACRDTJ_32695, partial [Pseudonocardiaceae bacterium]
TKGVADTQALIEALENLPAVDVERPSGQGQLGQDLVDDPRQFGVEVQRYLVDVDDVDVALGELT